MGKWAEAEGPEAANGVSLPFFLRVQLPSFTALAYISPFLHGTPVQARTGNRKEASQSKFLQAECLFRSSAGEEPPLNGADWLACQILSMCPEEVANCCPASLQETLEWAESTNRKGLSHLGRDDS